MLESSLKTQQSLASLCLDEYQSRVNLLMPHLLKLSEMGTPDQRYLALDLIDVVYEQGFGHISPLRDRVAVALSGCHFQWLDLDARSEYPTGRTFEYGALIDKSRHDVYLSNTTQAWVVRFLNPRGCPLKITASDAILAVPRLFAIRSPELWEECIYLAPIQDPVLMRAYELMTHFSPRLSQEICDEIPDLLTTFLGGNSCQRYAHSACVTVLTCYYLRLMIMKLQHTPRSMMQSNVLDGLGSIITFLAKEAFTC